MNKDNKGGRPRWASHVSGWATRVLFLQSRNLVRLLATVNPSSKVDENIFGIVLCCFHSNQTCSLTVSEILPLYMHHITRQDAQPPVLLGTVTAPRNKSNAGLSNELMIHVPQMVDIPEIVFHWWPQNDQFFLLDTECGRFGAADGLNQLCRYSVFCRTSID